MLIDYVEAARWFRSAAAQDDDRAQFLLGTMYFEAKGVPCDAVEAARLLSRSAEHGNTQAAAYLGRLYSGGYEGFPRDLVLALKWLTIAQISGNVHVQVIELSERLRKEMTEKEVSTAWALASTWKIQKVERRTNFEADSVMERLEQNHARILSIWEPCFR